MCHGSVVITARQSTRECALGTPTIPCSVNLLRLDSSPARPPRVNLPALKEAYTKFDGLLPLPVMKNGKTVDPRDKNSTKVRVCVCSCVRGGEGGGRLTQRNAGAAEGGMCL
jgi:hypothetical protein